MDAENDPEAAAQLAAVAASVVASSESLRRWSTQVSSAVQPLVEMAGRMQTAIEPIASSVRSMVTSASAAILRAIEEGTPTNWLQEEMFDSAVIDRRREIARAGIPVVWVPPRPVLEALDAANPSARADLLMSASDDVLADCERQLRGLPDTRATRPLDGDYPVECVLESISAYRAGHRRAAQALAVNVVEFVVIRALGVTWQHLSASSISLREDVAIFMLRSSLAMAPAASAGVSYWEAPVPTTLNRHATVHDLGPAQYRPVNSLCAVMLATSLLRELDHFPALPSLVQLKTPGR